MSTETYTQRYTPEEEIVTPVEAGVHDPTTPQAERADQPSTAAIGKHPLHPLAVTVPIGLLVGTTASDIAGLMSGDRFWARASRTLLGGALISGATAALLGATDFFTIRKARGPMGIAHAGGNATILGLSALSLLIRSGYRARIPRRAALLSGVAATMLMVTGWLGGEMSYRQGIGVVPPEER
jgi:uncharacterized membrane protein